MSAVLILGVYAHTSSHSLLGWCANMHTLAHSLYNKLYPVLNFLSFLHLIAFPEFISLSTSSKSICTKGIFLVSKLLKFIYP